MLTNCKILRAKSAGFCFGVARAVEMVYNELDNRNNVVTLGPIIHNANVVSDLKEKGVFPIELEDAKKGQTVIIRSHGVGLDVYDKLSTLGADIIDATCPFVAKIHKIANEKSKEGYTILIAGNAEHPEIIGIRGHCIGESYVFESPEDFEDLMKIQNFQGKKLAILSQTTYNKGTWEKCKRLFEKFTPDALVYDTICNATSERQREVRELAKQADIMIIVGGKNSSNTAKLKAICDEYCKCFLVENADGLRNCNIDLSCAKFIGISAGASTPAHIIEEVQHTMSDLLNDEEFNFEEEFEKTLKKIHTGMKVDGVVTAFNNGEVIVDIGTKHTGYIPVGEFSSDSSVKPEDTVKVGDTIELIVLKTNDQEGIVTLSKKKVDATVGFRKLAEAKENDETLTGVVTKVVRGGVLVSVNGVKILVPASQTGIKKDGDLNQLVKSTVEFKIIDVNEGRQRALGSIRAAASAKRAATMAKLFDEAQVGDKIDGVVRSITDYGVFVDLGGVDGLIKRFDLSWSKTKHPSEIVSVGDEITVTIKDIDKENKRIALSYKKEEDDPWNDFVNEYKEGQVVKATIDSIKEFGAFARIIDGVDGLIHISQVSKKRIDNVSDVLSIGQEVECKIIAINTEKRKISLSISALLPADE